jgi:enoyl-CoA hydratase
MLDVEVRGQVLVVTLNRPEARNAINDQLTEAIEAAIDRLESDPALWIGVLAGNGPVFCAGADLKAVARARTDGIKIETERGGFAGICYRKRTKPVIAAVDAMAVAGGCEIALSCDLIVASTAASFGLPEVKRSLVATGGGPHRLVEAVGPKIANEILLTGGTITAERAYQLGFVNRLVKPGTALDAALALAEEINANAPLAVRESLGLVQAAITQDGVALNRLAHESSGRLSQTDDFMEGPLAFIEKRPPVWKGC